MGREDTFYTNAVRNLAHGKSRIGGAFAFGDDNALECLNTLFFAFFNFYMDFDCVARPESRQVHAQMFFFQFIYFFHFSSNKLYFPGPKILSSMMATAERTDRWL